MAKKKVLAVVTSHEYMKNEKDKTGLWLSELVHFYDCLKLAGYEVDIVSTKGGKVPLDPKSLLPILLDNRTKEYYLDPYFISRLDKTASIDEIKSNEYGCIYFAGGHGTMWDFPNQSSIQKLTAEIYEKGGVVSAVCHGPAALLNVELSDGTHLLEGKTVTGYTNMEETIMFASHKIPFKLQNELTAKAGKFTKSAVPFTSHVVENERVITGQNPQSARAVGEKTLHFLQNQKRY